MATWEIGDWRKLGAVLRHARIEAGLSQQNLAERAQVSRAWLARVEAGHRKAELEPLLKLLHALNLTMAVQPRTRNPPLDAIADALAERDS